MQEARFVDIPDGSYVVASRYGSLIEGYYYQARRTLSRIHPYNSPRASFLGTDWGFVFRPGYEHIVEEMRQCSSGEELSEIEVRYGPWFLTVGNGEVTAVRKSSKRATRRGKRHRNRLSS